MCLNITYAAAHTKYQNNVANITPSVSTSNTKLPELNENARWNSLYERNRWRS